jgi:hypothetical protein
MQKLIILIILASVTISSYAVEMKCLYAKGTVHYIRSGAKKELLKNILLKVGDTVITENASLVILKFPNETVKVMENSSFQVSELNKKNDEFLINNGAVVINKLKHVLTDAISRNQQSSSLKVRTSNASMGIRGTTFFVYKGEKGQTILSVNDGVVAFKGEASEANVMVAKDTTTMTNDKNQNLKSRKFGFENKINYELNPDRNLESEKNLYETIEATWIQYKTEQEFAWKKKLESESNDWDKWKSDNSEL